MSAGEHGVCGEEVARLRKRIMRERRARQDAEALIESKSRELYYAIQNLEIANRAKTEFLNNMNHELRTPLNGIIGFSELLETGIAGELSPQQREYLTNILLSARRLHNLFMEILEVSDLDLSRSRLSMEKIDLMQLIPAAISPIVRKAIEKRVQVDFQAKTASHTAFVAPAAFRRALTNVVGNAIKFTNPGGKVAIMVAARADEETVVAVSDTGIGIPKEEIPRIMSPFYQVGKGIGREYEGAGLGLTIAKYFTEKQGGRIEIESTVGVGTVVRLHFPARDRCDSAICQPFADCTANGPEGQETFA